MSVRPAVASRRLSTELDDERLKENVALTTAALNDARKIITVQHEDMMAQSHHNTTKFSVLLSWAYESPDLVF